MMNEPTHLDLCQAPAQIFKVLMHPTRLAILDVLRTSEHCVCHMEAVLGLRQAHISQHLMVLREAGLVTDRRDGWNIYYRVTQPEIWAVMDATRHMLGQAALAPAEAQPLPNCPCPKCSPSASSELIPIEDLVKSG
jgi:DNA-binding transcriptional ArsR family regulator